MMDQVAQNSAVYHWPPYVFFLGINFPLNALFKLQAHIIRAYNMGVAPQSRWELKGKFTHGGFNVRWLSHLGQALSHQHRQTPARTRTRTVRGIGQWSRPTSCCHEMCSHSTCQVTGISLLHIHTTVILDLTIVILCNWHWYNQHTNIFWYMHIVNL